MSGRRTVYEIYWEILIFCRTGKSFTGIIGRCDLNSKSGREYLEFLESRGYLSSEKSGSKTTYTSTKKAEEYIALFTGLYQHVFETKPGFKL